MEYGLVNPTFVTHVLYRTFLTLATPPVDIESSRRRAQAAVLLMIQHGMSRESTELLPFSVGTPIWETLRTCQIWPPGDWPAEAYALIGRDDLAKFAVGELGAFGFGDAYRQRKALVGFSRFSQVGLSELTFFILLGRPG
jgi:anaphase-promoting complex subunit 1